MSSFCIYLLAGDVETSCNVCYEEYSHIRKPMIVCINNHTFCSNCCGHLEVCAMCRAPSFAKKKVNVALMEMVTNRSNALAEIPEIPIDELKELQKQPLASGAYSDVFFYQWNNQNVVLKKLRINPRSDQMKDIKKETSLAISLLHPNIVKVYGTTNLRDGLMGILMEYADRGDMSRNNMDKLDDLQKIKVSFGICLGIEYLHSKRVAHRDLKPENILLFGTRPIPKITDFGSSKVIQTMIQTTAMAGTPKYSAPETFERGAKFGVAVDVYSLAMIIYELFSGKNAYDGYDLMQVMMAINRKERPELPDDFPEALCDPVENGWSQDPDQRSSLEDFKNALNEMADVDLEDDARKVNSRKSFKVTSTTTANQTYETNSSIMPVSLISMKWPDSSDTSQSMAIREQMIKDVSEKSNMRKLIANPVLKAMGAVPRHLFMEPSRVSGSTFEAKVKQSYTYNKAMGATKHPSNESSPEIIGAQLSLVKIETGAHVLLVGGKGGYINSVVAQIVGINGKVITVSAQKDILDICKARVDKDSPFKNSMQWKLLNSVQDTNLVLSAFAKERFHAIIYCGATSPIPSSLVNLLSPSGGSIIAPVQLSNNKQQFQMVILSPEGDIEIRKITDFGVIFEEAK